MGLLIPAVSLIDKLREVEDFAPSHQPVIGEFAPIVGVLIAYIEHGEALFDAAEADRQAVANGEPAHHVNDLLSPPPDSGDATPGAATSSTSPAAAPPPSAISATPAPGGEDKDAEIAALKQQLATAQAQSGRTQVETGPPATRADEPPPPSPAVP